jgi:hypothetical protein
MTKTNKMLYRPGAPAGSMRRLAVPSFKKGGYEEGFPGSPRTLRRLDSESMYGRGPKPARGTPPEDIPGSPRTLCKLPASISDGGVD